MDYMNIETGDMPGDKVIIGDYHIKKAELIFPHLLPLLYMAMDKNPYKRAVVSVAGGSGVGKSETASLLAHFLRQKNIGAYTLSGDNYPYRIPEYNDAERLRIFRSNGIRGLIAHGQYSQEKIGVIKSMQEKENDANPAVIKDYPWIALYQKEGRNALKNYLGTKCEIDFEELSGIITEFKNGMEKIFLKRMGRKNTELWYDYVDFSNKNVIIIEWTHGNSHNLRGIDIPIHLNSTPQETLEYRCLRGRDGKTDSPFTTMVLEIEQDLLAGQVSRAELIVSKDGEIISYDDYLKRMRGEENE